jgi:hypothetical protein
MTTGLTVLIWLACAWIAAMFIATGVAIYRMRRDRKEKP